MFLIQLNKDFLKFTNMDPLMQQELKDYIRRIENVKKEQDDLSIDLREIYKDASSVGFDPKILKEVIRRRKSNKKEKDMEEELIETYIMAIES